MITDHKQLEVTQEQLRRLELVLAETDAGVCPSADLAAGDAPVCQGEADGTG